MSIRRPFLSALMLAFLSAAAAAPAGAIDAFYKADFKGWRDNRTDLGFNGMFDKVENGGVVTLAEGADFGKVMTPEKPIQMEITNSLMLQVELANLSDGTSVDIEVMEATPPYGGQRILAGITQSGTYAVSIGKLTGWKGIKTFWVAVWVGGPGASAQVTQLRIGENIATEKLAPAPGEAAPEAAAAPKSTFAALPDEVRKARLDLKADKSKQYAFFEDWKNGLNGWRDESVQAGMKSKAELVPGGGVIVTPKDRAPQCKFVSSIKPITVDFGKFPYFELVLDKEVKDGWAYVRLVQATNPDNFRVVINSLNQPGVYTANVPDLASWNSEQSFYLEIVLESSNLKVPISSLGFTNRLSSIKGLMAPLVQSLRSLELAPSKKSDILRVEVIADQTFRGGWYGDAAFSPVWDEVDRYGKLLLYQGFSEIVQKLYLFATINPADKVEIYASLGYDLINRSADGLNWENPYSRTVPSKIDYGLLRYQDFYLGNVSQIGTIYDPLFSDMTLKKASTVRGALWKPQIKDWRFKFYGTREDADVTSNYRLGVYTVGGRVARDFSFDLGTVQLGASAVNMALSNGQMDNHLFQGNYDQGIEKTFAPAIYLRVDNNTNTTIYYKDSANTPTYVYVSLTAATGPTAVVANLAPPSGNAFIFQENNTYFDGTAKGINKGGYIIYKIPLVVNGAPIDNPQAITGIGILYGVGGWTASSYSGSVSMSVASSTTEPWQWLGSAPVGTVAEPLATFDHLLDSGQLAQLLGGKFDQTEGPMARSILGLDARGQILGINLDGEYVSSLAHNMTFFGTRVTRRTDGYYLNFSRGISGILLKGAWFNMPPEFSTSLGKFDAVDDNDNRALTADNYIGKSGVVFGDFYNQGVPTTEYVNGLYVPQDYLFHERDDQNHNGVLDDRENDHEPDYPYRRDQRGYKLFVVIPRAILEGLFLSNTEITLEGHYINRNSTPGHNQTTSVDVKYRNSEYQDLDFQVSLYAARIRDNLSNQYPLYDADNTQFQLVNAYPDNLVVTPEIMVSYEMPRGPQVTLLDRFRYNQQFSDDAYTLLGKRQGNMAVADLRYKIYLVGTLSTEPVYVGRFGAVQANPWSPIHNSYYVPVERDTSVTGDIWDLPINHSFYLRNGYVLSKEYTLSLDLGRELNRFARGGHADEYILDRLAAGVLRDLPGGYVRVHYELSKAYFPNDLWRNWSLGAVFAQITLNF